MDSTTSLSTVWKFTNTYMKWCDNYNNHYFIGIKHFWCYRASLVGVQRNQIAIFIPFDLNMTLSVCSLTCSNQESLAFKKETLQITSYYLSTAACMYPLCYEGVMFHNEVMRNTGSSRMYEVGLAPDHAPWYLTMPITPTILLQWQSIWSIICMIKTSWTRRNQTNCTHSKHLPCRIFVISWNIHCCCSYTEIPA